MSSPLEYYANLPLSPEAPEQGIPEQGIPELGVPVGVPEQGAQDTGALDTGALDAEAGSDIVQAKAALVAATGEEALAAATGEEALVAATGEEALAAATGEEALAAATVEEALVAATGEEALVAIAGEEALVAVVGDIQLTKAEVAQAVHLAVAGAVEQAVSGAVRSAVEAAVKANVNPLAAEARFKQKYLGIYPAASVESAPDDDLTVPIVEVPRIVLSASGVPTVMPAPTAETEAVAEIEAEIESAFEADAACFEQAAEPAEETEAMLEAETGVAETDVAAEGAEPLAEIKTASEIESDEFVEQIQPASEAVEAVLEDAAEAVLEEAAEEILEEAAEAPLEEAAEAPLEEVAEAPLEEVAEAPLEEVAEAPLEEAAEAVLEEVAEEILAVAEPLEEITVEPVVELAPTPADVQAVAVQPMAVQPVAAQPPAVQADQVAESEHSALVSIPATEQSGIPAMRESKLREEKSVQFVGFLVGTQMYAVPSVLIKEVIRRQPTNRLPVQTRYVTGVINLRGQVMPLVSLRELLLTDMPEDGVCNQFSIITGQGNMLIALEVDRIRSMYVIQQEEIVWNVSGVLGLDDESVIGLFELDERLVPILSMERIAAMLLEEGLDMANLVV